MAKRSKRSIAFTTRPRPDLWSDEELVVMLFDRLADFSVGGISITLGEDIEQVFVEFAMSRSPEPSFDDQIVAEGEKESPGFAARVEKRTNARIARRRYRRG